LPIASLDQILNPAFEQRYGVAAFNVVNDLTVDAVIAAATELDSPVILQTSLKTVKAVGARPLYALVKAFADETPVPVALHLDHCPSREWISACLEAGWGSVLFDGSALAVDDNTRQTAAVVDEARAYGALVEGELESVLGIEDDIGSSGGVVVHPTAVSAEFISATGVYCFAPAIGTAHGLYRSKPELMPGRVTELVDRAPIPMVLHGGTGLSDAQFHDLIARGCAKVNISTALKIAFVDGSRSYLEANPSKHDPASMLEHVRSAVKDVAASHLQLFGAAGRASVVSG
jgi:ketose-bisphosphate aldolase